MLSKISPQIQLVEEGLIRYTICAEYNMSHNNVGVTTSNEYVLRIDCNVAEYRLWTTSCSHNIAVPFIMIVFPASMPHKNNLLLHLRQSGNLPR